jgi:7-cyano-7-deazaguanine synthase
MAESRLQLEQVPKSDRAVLLFSGGFDSTLVGLVLKSAKVHTIAVTIDYPTRPPGERVRCERLSRALQLDEHITVDIPLVDLRTSENAWQEDKHEAWFPYRNLIFFGVAAHIAHYNSCDTIASGIRVWDSPYYDDATPEYFMSLSHLMEFSGRSSASRKLNLYLPLISSHELAGQALQIDEWRDVLLETWSCWRNGDEPCRTCVPCVSRQRFINEIDGE